MGVGFSPSSCVVQCEEEGGPQRQGAWPEAHSLPVGGVIPTDVSCMPEGEAGWQACGREDTQPFESAHWSLKPVRESTGFPGCPCAHVLYVGSCHASLCDL